MKRTYYVVDVSRFVILGEYSSLDAARAASESHAGEYVPRVVVRASDAAFRLVTDRRAADLYDMAVDYD